jgi:hypothetical protein
MGGVVQAVTKPFGGGGGKAPVQAVAETKPVETAVQKASAAEEQAGARMRGARRRGRQLLSDARLNAEAGIETLGGGNSLGQ